MSNLKSPASLSELRDRVAVIARRLGVTKQPWYRGHAKGRVYKLLPTLMRESNDRGLRHECLLYTTFCDLGRRNAREQLGSGTVNPWQVLSLMQHHGTPTRLLDWTETLDYAIFFAIQGKVLEPCIWILNPWRLNYKTFQEHVLFDEHDRLEDRHLTGDKPIADYYSEIRSPTGWRVSLPIAICPAPVNDRMHAQRGVFTLHGNQVESLETLCPDCVQRVWIPRRIIPRLRRELIEAGVTAYQIFPDLHGLSQSLRDRFRLQQT